MSLIVGFVLTVIANFYTVCDKMALKRMSHAGFYDFKWLFLSLEYLSKRKGIDWQALNLTDVQARQVQNILASSIDAQSSLNFFLNF